MFKTEWVLISTKSSDIIENAYVTHICSQVWTSYSFLEKNVDVYAKEKVTMIALGNTHLWVSFPTSLIDESIQWWYEVNRLLAQSMFQVYIVIFVYPFLEFKKIGLD